MARPTKRTIDYFPHNTSHGKTLFIIESRWGNDGYSFWFKLLETLGCNDGMFIDCDDDSSWEFLLAKTRVSSETANDILLTLSKLGAIDEEAWRARVVFSQNFVDGVSDAFKRRTEHLPDISGVFAYINTEKPDIMHALNLKGKGKGKGKEEENKDRRAFTPPTHEEVKDYCEDRKNRVDADKFVNFYSSKGWMIGKNKMKDWKAAVRTWERDTTHTKNSQPHIPIGKPELQAAADAYRKEHGLDEK